MKKIYTLILLSISISFSAQVEGSWSLNPAAGALAVGPDSGSRLGGLVMQQRDLTTRDCLFDDSITFFMPMVTLCTTWMVLHG